MRLAKKMTLQGVDEAKLFASEGNLELSATKKAIKLDAKTDIEANADGDMTLTAAKKAELLAVSWGLKIDGSG